MIIPTFFAGTSGRRRWAYREKERQAAPDPFVKNAQALAPNFGKSASGWSTVHPASEL